MSFLKKISAFFKARARRLNLALLVGLIIPNIMLVIICYHFGLSRPLINIDYVIPIVLISLLSFRFSWLLLFSFFFIAFFIDILLIALQIFPFITLSDILYLSNFIFLGDISYRLYLLLFTILLFVEYIVISAIAIRLKVADFIMVFMVLISLQAYTSFNSNENDVNKLLANNLIRSDLLFLVNNHNANFFTLKHLTALKPTSFQTASDPWFKEIVADKPLAKKLLLVVNESWGFPRDPLIQEETLKELKANSQLFDYFHQGSFHVMGATVAGELRELCQLDPQLMNLANVNEGFENCLPNKLIQRGYQTIALHGNTTVMYERTHWYPLAGIKKMYFGNDINLPKDSFDNSGIFDPNLIPFIEEKFKQNDKLFLHWMTLTSHTPYSKSDIRDNRFFCKAFSIELDSEVCRNLMLQTQFFDSLAKLVKSPSMQGAEVIVVGDHPPPLLNFTQGINTFTPSKVSWIHFKVKDNINSNQQKQNNGNNNPHLK